VTIRSPAEARDPTAWMVADLPRTTNLNEARAFCRAVARRHYENFPVVSLLVPRRLRQDFANVYAFARWSDDLADESGDPSAASSRLSAWRRDLASCFRGEAEHPVFVALAETVGRTGLSIDPFSRLLDAFERDQRQTTYATREELLGYCGNSANPVGRIVLALEGCRDPDRLALSDAICTGLQLVNFWQDIRRDRLAGRVYVPQEDLVRHGLTEADLTATHANAAMRDLVRGLVAWTDEFFVRGSPLVRSAPPSLRAAIGGFVDGGRAISAAIRKSGYDTLASRPVLGTLTKAKLAAMTMLRVVAGSGGGTT
jgi:squalene synthase HpnC